MATIRFESPWWRDSSTTLGRVRRDMEETLERLESGELWGRRGTPFPPVNLYETPGGYVLTAELPGVSSEDIGVSVEGSRVTIRGKRKIDYPAEPRTSLHRRERQTGIFRRTFELPIPVDSDSTEATCRHGVLMLKIPKAKQYQPRKIAVKAG